jgi:hypothetical protein
MKTADAMMRLNMPINIDPYSSYGYSDILIGSVAFCKKLLITLYPTYKKQIDPILRNVTKDTIGDLLIRLINLEKESGGKNDAQYIYHQFEDSDRIVIFNSQANSYAYYPAYVNFMQEIEGTRVFDLFMNMFSLIESCSVYLWRMYDEGLDNYIFCEGDEEAFSSPYGNDGENEREQAKVVFKLLNEGYPHKLYEKVSSIHTTEKQFANKLKWFRPKNLFEELALSILKDCSYCIHHDWSPYIQSMPENYEMNPITPNEPMRFQWNDPFINDLYNNYFETPDIYWEYFYNMIIIDAKKCEPEIIKGDQIIARWINLFETWNERITNMMEQWKQIV